MRSPSHIFLMGSFNCPFCTLSIINCQMTNTQIWINDNVSSIKEIYYCNQYVNPTIPCVVWNASPSSPPHWNQQNIPEKQWHQSLLQSTRQECRTYLILHCKQEPRTSSFPACDRSIAPLLKKGKHELHKMKHFERDREFQNKFLQNRQRSGHFIQKKNSIQVKTKNSEMLAMLL